MKKLLTLLGITAFALGAFADAALPSGTSFENHTLGKFDFTGDEPGTSGAKYWVSTASDIEASVAEYGSGEAFAKEVGRPAQFSGDNTRYLNIESASAPLYRAILPVSGELDTTDSLVRTNIGSGLYVDTLVQFSVAQGDQDVTDGNVKLAIWVQTGEEDGTPTNFYVHAGYFQDSSTLVTNNYKMTTPQGFDFNGWHRLTVKAIGDIGGDGFVGFVVFVDGDMLTRADNATIGTSPTLTAEAQQFADGLLPSAVHKNLLGSDTLSAVGFSGNGSVDDISFTATAPDFAESELVFSLTVGEGVTGFTLNDGQGNTTNVTGVAENDVVNFTIAGYATTVTVSDVGYASDYKDAALSDENDGTINGLEFTLGKDATNPSAKISAVRDLFTITVDGTTYGYATLAAAIADASRGTIVVAEDYNVGDHENARIEVNGNVTVDLAGHTISGPDNRAIFHAKAGASLTIVNTENTEGVLRGVADARKDAKALSAASTGSITIGSAEDGAFVVVEGSVPASATYIVKGKFEEANNSDDDEEFAVVGENIAPGSELATTTADGYWVVDIAAEPPAPATYTVTFYTNSVVYTTAQYTYNDANTYTPPADPVIEGYGFGGWFTDDGTFENAFIFYATVEGNTQVAYAKLTAVPEPPASFTVRIVSSDSSTQNYNTLADAIDAYEDGDVIEFGSDFENLTERTVVFTAAGEYKFAYDNDYDSTYANMTAASDFLMTSTWPTEQNLYFTYTVTAKPVNPYAAWDYASESGIVVWRGTQDNFHESTVADVDANGNVGTEYTLNTAGHPWKVFASGQSEYTSPGKVLVYDDPGEGDGYKYDPNCTFSPLSFGGMWVKTLAINGQPFSVVGTSANNRYTEFGANGKSTLFKFDASYTINRSSATTFLGDATVDIAAGATFTAQANSNVGVAVDSAATLKLKGAGTLAVTTMEVNGTLDLSETTRPAISGNVAFAAGSTIVLPAGTTAPFTVCSGTLTSSGVVNVKVGDEAPYEAVLSVSGGAISEIAVAGTYTATISGDTTISAIQWQKGGAAAELPSNLALAALVINGSGTVTGLSAVPASVTLASGVTLDVTAIASSFADLTKSSAGTYMFTDNYPLSVPQGYTYEYVGGSTEAETATISGGMLNNQGNLITSGYLAIDNFWMGWTTATLDVLDGRTTIGAGNQKALRGIVTIRASAELVNARTADALAYDAQTEINVYGTLSMGATRWTLGAMNTIRLYDGAQITGQGEGNYGAFDFYGSATIDAQGTASIATPIRYRSDARIRVASDKTLTLSATSDADETSKGIVKSGDGILKFVRNPALGAGVTVNGGTLVFDTQNDVTVTAYYTNGVPGTATTSLWYARQDNWKGRVVLGPLSAPGQLALDTFGNTNSFVVLKGITGNAYFANGIKIAPEVVIDGDVQFNNGSSGQTYTFRKVSCSNSEKKLGFKFWGGCSSLTWKIEELNEFAGTIEVINESTHASAGDKHKLTIGNIVKAGAKVDDKLVTLNQSVTTEGNFNTITASTLNGRTATFEVKDDGLYVTSIGGGFDPAEGDTEVTVKIDDAGKTKEQIDAAVAAAAAEEVSVPDGSGITGATYLGYFNTKVEGSDGEYTLTIEGLKEEVKAEVEASAIDAAQAGSDKATVTTKPGLYYGFVVGDSPSLADPAELQLATGTSMTVDTSSLKNKTSGFAKTVISTRPTMDKE